MARKPGQNSYNLLDAEERKPTFERCKAIMQMFSDNAKTYIQLSGAGLALTLTFADRILRLPTTENIANGWMIAVWVCFLLAIVAGAFYQYLAVKLLDSSLDWQHDKTWLWLQPGFVYALMLFAFYGATILFTIYAIVRIRYR